MKIFHARADEAKLLVENDSGIFIGMLKDQLPEGYEFYAICDTYTEIITRNYDTLDVVKPCAVFESKHNSIKVPLSHPSGKYYVKEPWAKRWPYFDDGQDMSTIADWVLVYKADIPQAEWDKYYWRSPVTMPKEAIRWTIEIETVIKRVSELVPEELESYGVEVTLNPDPYITAVKYKRSNKLRE